MSLESKETALERAQRNHSDDVALRDYYKVEMDLITCMACLNHGPVGTGKWKVEHDHDANKVLKRNITAKRDAIRKAVNKFKLHLKSVHSKLPGVQNAPSLEASGFSSDCTPSRKTKMTAAPTRSNNCNEWEAESQPSGKRRRMEESDEHTSSHSGGGISAHELLQDVKETVRSATMKEMEKQMKHLEKQLEVEVEARENLEKNHARVQEKLKAIEKELVEFRTRSAIELEVERAATQFVRSQMHNAQSELNEVRRCHGRAEGERDEARNNSAELMSRLQTMMKERDAANVEANLVKAERDEAMRERDGAREMLENAKGDIEDARGAADKMKVERDEAKDAADKMKVERDDAKDAADKMKVERNKARDAAEKIKVERDEARNSSAEMMSRWQTMVKQRDAAIVVAEKAKAERDKAMRERDGAREMLENAKGDIEDARGVADKMKVERDEARGAADKMKVERDEARGVADKMKVERDEARGAAERMKAGNEEEAGSEDDAVPYGSREELEEALRRERRKAAAAKGVKTRRARQEFRATNKVASDEKKRQAAEDMRKRNAEMEAQRREKERQERQEKDRHERERRERERRERERHEKEKKEAEAARKEKERVAEAEKKRAADEAKKEAERAAEAAKKSEYRKRGNWVCHLRHAVVEKRGDSVVSLTEKDYKLIFRQLQMSLHTDKHGDATPEEKKIVNLKFQEFSAWYSDKKGNRNFYNDISRSLSVCEIICGENCGKHVNFCYFAPNTNPANWNPED